MIIEKLTLESLLGDDFGNSAIRQNLLVSPKEDKLSTIEVVLHKAREHGYIETHFIGNDKNPAHVHAYIGDISKDENEVCRVNITGDKPESIANVMCRTTPADHYRKTIKKEIYEDILKWANRPPLADEHFSNSKNRWIQMQKMWDEMEGAMIQAKRRTPRPTWKD
jgi:hypothetical protein